MSLLNAGRELNRKQLIIPHALYIGTVVNNNDPMKLQRIRARIRDIHRGVPDDQLPWCLPLVNLFASNTQIGQMGPIPTISSRVYISFLDDSPYFPVYAGGIVSEDRKLEEFTEGPLGEHYPHVYGAIDRSGNRWYVDTSTEKDGDSVELRHVSGTGIYIDRDGNARFEISGNLEFHVGGKMYFMSKGSSRFHSGGNMDHVAPRIDLNTNSLVSPDKVKPRKRPIEEPFDDRLDY